MLDRNLEAVHLPSLLKNNIGFLVYSPLAKGLLSGKIPPDPEIWGDKNAAADDLTLSAHELKVIDQAIEQFSEAGANL